jgi:hypothetical protein
MNPTLPSIRPMPDEILKDNSLQYYDSWKWLVDQYNRKKESIEKYMQREEYNHEYAMREKAFITSLGTHLNHLRDRLQYFHDLQQLQLKKEIRDNALIETLFSIMRMYGITKIPETLLIDTKARERVLNEVGAVMIPNELKDKI